MILSLIICTFNRADILKVTLPYILKLKIPEDLKVELIIIDNNSTDNTRLVSKESIFEFEGLFKGKLKGKYFFEPIQGLSQARNRGYFESTGEYIVYIDDECVLPREWLIEAKKIIDQVKPAFLGGPFLGKYLPGSSSKWFKESFGDSHMLQYDLQNGAIKDRYLSGGNLFIRRDVFEKVGVFDTNLGMSGNTINYGEEHELQIRFIKVYPNELIWYDDSIFLWHLIRDEKMRLSYLMKDALIRGKSAAELKKSPRKALMHAPFYLVYFIFKALFSAIHKGIRSMLFKENYFYLLYDDYKYGTWRGIGSSIYKTKKLFGFNK